MDMDMDYFQIGELGRNLCGISNIPSMKIVENASSYKQKTKH
jgi:hypothetical protein